jgi:predicted secreted protein
MNIFSGIVVYVLTWWVVFFCMLPVNIKIIEKPVSGHMPGAPDNPHIKGKLILTSVISVFVWGLIYLVIKSDLLSFREMASHMRM